MTKEYMACVIAYDYADVFENTMELACDEMYELIKEIIRRFTNSHKKRD